MIDFTKSPQEIAKELISKFRQRTSVVIDPDEEDEEWQKSERYWAAQQAELAVIFALQFVPEFKGNRNPDHTKLTEVLEILKSKI